MTGTATLDRMAERKVTNRRQLAGKIAQDERLRMHLKQDDAAQAWNITRGTLSRVESGSDLAGSGAYRNVEGGLGLPRHFFTYVIDGDRERIARLPDLDEGLRHYVLEALDDLAEANPGRRSSDRAERRRQA
jgi:transcriptional regulator with XRE-family HTH domain